MHTVILGRDGIPEKLVFCGYLSKIFFVNGNVCVKSIRRIMFDILFAEFLVNNLRGISDSEALVKSGLAAGLGPRAPHALQPGQYFAMKWKREKNRNLKRR